MSDTIKQTTEAAKDVLTGNEAEDSAFVGKVRDARDKLSGMLNDLNSKMDDLGSAVKEKGHQAGEKVKEGVEGTEKCIQSHPFSSVGVALGVGIGIGVAIGLLINRKQ